MKLALLILILTTTVQAQAPEPALAKGLDLLEQGRTSLDETKLATARGYFTNLTEQDATNFADGYALARVQSYQAEAFAAANKKNDAERAVDAATTSEERTTGRTGMPADA